MNRRLRNVAALLIYVDLCVTFRIASVLIWMEEWLFIPQKRVEQGLIVIYGLLMVMPHHSTAPWSTAFNVPMTLLICAMMWRWHRQPAAARQSVNIISMIVRPILAGILLVNGILLCVIHDYFGGVAQVVYAMIWYVTDISSNGERGRRAKLAWSKLKELFGPMEWIPRPVEAE